MNKKKYLILVLVVISSSYIVIQNIDTSENQITKSVHTQIKNKDITIPSYITNKITNNTPKKYQNRQAQVVKKDIKHHLKLITSFGEDAESNYMKSLEKLKKNKDIATLELSKQYESTKVKDYKTRQEIVETIRALHSEKSIPVLEKIIHTDIPEEYEDLHNGSTRLEEGIIRLTAIEAIGYFANHSKNKKVATELLLQIVSSSTNPLQLKRQAAREFLQASYNKEQLNDRKEILKNIIPSEQHFIITEKIDKPEDIEMDTHNIVMPESYEFEREIDKKAPKVDTH